MLLYLIILKQFIFFINIASKGIGANMLKIGTKRRRTAQQIEDEKQEEKLKQQ